MAGTEVIRNWVEYFNTRDIARYMGLYADDASFRICFAPVVEGKAAIREMSEAYFAAAPLHCIVKGLYAGEGGRVILEWEDKVGLLGVNIYDLEDGLIRHQRNYFDQLSFLRLNGLPLPTE